MKSFFSICLFLLVCITFTVGIITAASNTAIYTDDVDDVDLLSTAPGGNKTGWYENADITPPYGYGVPLVSTPDKSIL